jgi:hypothetical protein
VIPGCLLLSCFVLVAVGCINVDQEITLDENGGGQMKVLVSARLSFYSSEEFGRTDVDIETAFEEITFREGITLVSEKEYDTEGFHIWEKHYLFSHIRQLGNQDLNITLQKDGDDHVLGLEAVLVNEAHPGLTKEELERDDIQQLLAELAGYRYRLKIIVPKPVKEAPEAQVEGRSASWEMTLDRMLNPRRKTMRMRIVF